MRDRSLVVLESPYAGDIEENVKYARECVKHSLGENEAPFASHLLYTQSGILNDSIAEERTRGIHAGHQWMEAADFCVVYTDRGISKGMKEGIALAHRLGIPVIYRSIHSGVDGEQKVTTINNEKRESNLIPSTGCRRFRLVRQEDPSGVSGLGVVAEGCKFSNGTIVVSWLTSVNSTEVLRSMEDNEKIHGHDGKTRIEWMDQQ